MIGGGVGLTEVGVFRRLGRLIAFRVEDTGVGRGGAVEERVWRGWHAAGSGCDPCLAWSRAPMKGGTAAEVAIDRADGSSEYVWEPGSARVPTFSLCAASSVTAYCPLPGSAIPGGGDGDLPLAVLAPGEGGGDPKSESESSSEFPSCGCSGRITIWY